MFSAYCLLHNPLQFSSHLEAKTQRFAKYVGYYVLKDAATSNIEYQIKPTKRPNVE